MGATVSDRLSFSLKKVSKERAFFVSPKNQRRPARRWADCLNFSLEKSFKQQKNINFLLEESLIKDDFFFGISQKRNKKGKQMPTPHLHFHPQFSVSTENSTNKNDSLLLFDKSEIKNELLFVLTKRSKKQQFLSKERH